MKTPAAGSTPALLTPLLRSPFPSVGKGVVVAVSGGPDSTALLVAAIEAGHGVVAAHYDHALREGSERTADEVAALCQNLGVRLIRERRGGPMPRGSVQAAARSLRYGFLERAAVMSSADAVALAHNADDLVEGAVLHLMRGAGFGGLRGMPAQRGIFVRPWLGVWREEILEFLRSRDIVAFEDPANSDVRYARVRVRQLLPQLERDRPGIVRRLHAVAMRAGDLHERVAHLANRALEATLTDRDLRDLERPVAFEALRLLYARAGGAQPGLSRAQLLAMLRAADGSRGGRGVDLPRGLRFRVVGGRPEIVALASINERRNESPDSERLPAPRLEIHACSGCAEPGAAHLRTGLDLRVGYRTPGLRMRPIGARGTRKLQDILVDARVPREERATWPLVFAGERLAWVPGVAVAADAAAEPGQPFIHVSVVPMPVRAGNKVASLDLRRVH